MAVPKKKTSYSKKRKRNSHNSIVAKNFYIDDFGKPCLPHRISANGMYKGRMVFTENPLLSEKKNEEEN